MRQKSQISGNWAGRRKFNSVSENLPTTWLHGNETIPSKILHLSPQQSNFLAIRPGQLDRLCSCHRILGKRLCTGPSASTHGNRPKVSKDARHKGEITDKASRNKAIPRTDC